MNHTQILNKTEAAEAGHLKVSDGMFYGLVILGFAGAGASALTGDYGLWAYLTGTGLGGALVATFRPRLVGPCVCGDELAAAISAAERSGFDEGVRYGVEWEDHYLRRAEPLSEDHVFDGLQPASERSKIEVVNYPAKSIAKFHDAQNASRTGKFRAECLILSWNFHPPTYVEGRSTTSAFE
jgi:hypothetical protein